MVTTVSTVTLVTTQFFGAFPPNPISSSFQQVISSALPSSAVEAFNRFVANFDYPGIESNPEIPDSVDPVGLIEIWVLGASETYNPPPQSQTGFNPLRAIETWINGGESGSND